MSVPPSESHVSCWNQTGVWGTRDCPKLADCFHCRHCPVYSAAASRLLDREMQSDYAEETFRAFSGSELTEREEMDSAVLFRVGNEWLGLETSAFAEVMEPSRVHRIPHRPDRALLGLVNVRGELLVCVCLGEILGMTTGKVETARRRFMVVEAKEGRLVLPVDEVHGVHRYAVKSLVAPPATITRARDSFSRSLVMWRDHQVGILDREILFAAINRSLA